MADGGAGLLPAGSTSAARTHTNAALKLFQQNCQTNGTVGGDRAWDAEGDGKGAAATRQIPRLVGCDLMQQKQAE